MLFVSSESYPKNLRARCEIRPLFKGKAALAAVHRALSAGVLSFRH
jgi:hypothetical protein